MGNVKNYMEQGGSQWVVNGTLEITEEGQIILNGKSITRVANQADSVAATVTSLKDDFNGLLLKLKNAGLMAEE